VAEVAGLIVLVMAGMYSANPWAHGTAPAIVVGVLALLVPLVGVPLTARRHPVLPVALVVLGHLFLFLFLFRALAINGDTAIWFLDGALLAAGAVLFARLASGSAAEWELHAAALSLYVAALLILATGVAPLDLGNDGTVYPLDVWWLGSTAAILWAVHRAPERLRRDWYTHGLVVAVILGVGLAFWTSLGALEAPPEVAALAVAALGGAGMLYALRQEARALLVTSAGAVVVAAWYYGGERGRALGGVVALFATAALLFWVAGRLGAMREGDRSWSRWNSTSTAGPTGTSAPGGYSAGRCWRRHWWPHSARWVRSAWRIRCTAISSCRATSTCPSSTSWIACGTDGASPRGGSRPSRTAAPSSTCPLPSR
jgi:hypothetical protein